MPAPKARNMKAGASVKRSGMRRPWLQRTFLNRALKVRNIKRQLFRSFRASRSIALYQGRRASLCSALAPGFHISRLWRCRGDFCASFAYEAVAAVARSFAFTKGTSTRCSLKNQICNSLVRITSLTTRSLVPSSPRSAARRANGRDC